MESENTLILKREQREEPELKSQTGRGCICDCEATTDPDRWRRQASNISQASSFGLAVALVGIYISISQRIELLSHPEGMVPDGTQWQESRSAKRG